MNNPNGPYPGRQLFVGLTADNNPCFAYLVTGRSPQSRERLATQVENKVIMGPLGDVPYDPLRHYTAVEYDKNSGILVVSNGIQTEAILETYKLLYNVDSTPAADYLKMLMQGAMAEPDSIHTPRVAAVITGKPEEAGLVQVVGIVTYEAGAKTWLVRQEKGVLAGVSTYAGDMESTPPFNIDGELPKLSVEGKTAAELAEYLYGISHATNNSEDIRVCAIGGVLKNKNWGLAIINAHQS